MLTTVSKTEGDEMEAATKAKPGRRKPIDKAVEVDVRLAFLEAAVTVLTRELVARGIAPRTFEDRVIGEAELLMDVRLEPVKGRGELVAAFLNGD